MFIPGPVDVAPEVLAAQARPMVPHRSKDFETVFRRVSEKAQRVFYTHAPVYVCTSSGSGMQEAGIRNFVHDKVLCCVNGASSSRWYDIALANGKQADMMEMEWGSGLTAEKLSDALKQQKYDAVTIVHNEISTGLENPIKELAGIVRQVSPDTLILVDAASSLGGAKIEMDAWGIDFLSTASQYCLGLPPGLSLAAVSERALKRAETIPGRGWYFDVVLMEKHRLKDSTPMTPAMPLVYALDIQLDRILSEGLENRFSRHRALAIRVRSWAVQKGFMPFGDPVFFSKTVSVFHNSPGWDISDLNRFLLQRGMRISDGYGPLKGKTFRIAHMGELQMPALDHLIFAIEAYIKMG